MGFDIVGIEPKNKKGEHFRNNIWWWPRLWDFCCHVAGCVTEQEQRRGHHNCGLVIEGEKHERLVRGLKKALEAKGAHALWIAQTENYASERSELIKRLFEKIEVAAAKSGAMMKPQECAYPFSWENVQEFFEFAKSNRGFKIY